VASRTLDRVLGLRDLILIVIGTVIGSGVFRKPHDVAKQLDYFGLIALAWVMGGLLALLGSSILIALAWMHRTADR
jgi:amino acid transporter